MNAIASFRLCTLTDKELIQAIDKHVDSMYQRGGEIPRRHIPARPNEDFDLLIGELLYRFSEVSDVHFTAKKFDFPDYDTEQMRPANKLPDCPSCGNDELYMPNADTLKCYACNYERERV